ncbi:RNA-directed DNA polymerase (reverse transcriptase), partial [Parasponia andersonii]
KGYGFGIHFRRLFMHYITTVSYSILINSSHLPSFQPKRGLRKGGPLSSYLFILCSEILSKLIARKELRGKISGVKIAPNCHPITHLMYANDNFLFCEVEKKSCS